MKTGIGGYFELESHLLEAGKPMHSQALALTSGRACLARYLAHTRPSKLWIPYYCCDAILQPLIETKTPFSFYEIDRNLEPITLPLLGQEEAILYINYFGIKEEYSLSLLEQFRERLIIDNTQAFFVEMRQKGWAFNSARKFFGVPDGAYLYSPEPLKPPSVVNHLVHMEHLLSRLQGDRQKGYEQFLKAENEVSSENRGMSLQSSRLLSGVDYPRVAQSRLRNYAHYQQALDSVNQLRFPPLRAGSIPFCYPLLLDHQINREPLYQQEIFIPTLWKECLDRDVSGFSWEKELTRRLLPLPLDHRYSENDCDRVVEAVTAL